MNKKVTAKQFMKDMAMNDAINIVNKAFDDCEFDINRGLSTALTVTKNNTLACISYLAIKHHSIYMDENIFFEIYAKLANAGLSHQLIKKFFGTTFGLIMLRKMHIKIETGYSISISKSCMYNIESTRIRHGFDPGPDSTVEYFETIDIV